MGAKTTAPVKWVVPGRRPAAPPPRPSTPEVSRLRGRLRLAGVLSAVACLLAALVLYLARPEDVAPRPAPVKVYRAYAPGEVYESENVRMVIKRQPPAGETEEVAGEPSSP